MHPPHCAAGAPADQRLFDPGRSARGTGLVRVAVLCAGVKVGRHQTRQF